MKRRGRFEPPRGQAMVEFALVFGVLLLLMLAILDFGRVIFASNDASHAARDATRQASVSPLDCESIYFIVQHQTQANSDVTVSIDYRSQPSLTTPNPSWNQITCPAPYDPSATYDSDPSTGALGTVAGTIKVGDEVRVTVRNHIGLATPVISNLVGNAVDVRGSSAMSITFVPQ